MKVTSVGTDEASLTLDAYEQTIVHEALSQLAKQFDADGYSDLKEHAVTVRKMASQLEGARL